MATIYNSQLDAFTLHHQIQENPSSTSTGPGLPALGHALAGSAGTAISNIAIYPLDLVITRLQVQRSLRKSVSTPDESEYKGVLDAFEKIYDKEGGISAFYTGIFQDTGKSIADSFLFFLFYNYLRTNRLQKNGSKSTSLPALDELAVGALAGACSKFFTTPISNIVTRKQTASLLSSRSSTPSSEPTVSGIASTIRQEKGLQGFWSGYSASLVLTLNPSLTFFLYEFFKRSFLPRSQRDNPGAKLTFLIAAMSKAIASTITYPFSLAKARAQTSSSPPVDPSSAEKVKDELEHSESQKAEKDAKHVAKKSTVFHTILKIYREEGASGLYEGVWGEILKGFFSHGITMLLKESIHKLIIQSYYLILKALDKYPSPTELAAQAGVAIQDRAERAGEIVREGFENAAEAASGAVQGGSKAVSDVAERTGARTMLKEGYENAAGRVSAAVDSGKEAVGIVVDKAGIKGDNATKAVQAANDYASKDAGHLLGNAQEMLGGKIQEGGKGIKPEK